MSWPHWNKTMQMQCFYQQSATLQPKYIKEPTLESLTTASPSLSWHKDTNQGCCTKSQITQPLKLSVGQKKLKHLRKQKQYKHFKIGDMDNRFPSTETNHLKNSIMMTASISSRAKTTFENSGAGPYICHDLVTITRFLHPWSLGL